MVQALNFIKELASDSFDRRLPVNAVDWYKCFTGALSLVTAFSSISYTDVPPSD
ncbi:hypothetical protein [Pleionea litopenaei]|uniref:Uncharacterized protein n=1 Tax=Pleionea litopenaei TaxID=3070815 RepID=A0AA51RUK6_9GAMM|nr:hypothetical protein [Pleionea sp. HL-JVS1]WMS87763.1 hypothetical protein Q9312_02280 [Pleionea sp. HL-JVS1]